ncbi:MAG TPA: acylphosphatase [Sphingomicrobium sp.]|nr:acylphosphatase [Sphingomicrobium sp.]
MLIARKVRVRGRVQGVFFRAWTRAEAERLGLAGWVRNCADGSVEAHIEGNEIALAELMARLHRGPPSAEVHDVLIENAPAEGLATFEVRG